MNYQDFLARKRISDPMTGMEAVGELPAFLFPHQRDIVSWALRRGRAAIFAGTGLGKTAMELVWSNKVAEHTGKPVLIFAPLAVSAQHIREADKFGLTARIVKEQADVQPGVNVTNYQKIGHFDLSAFGGIVLDESSILKSTDGHYRTRLIEECAGIPFRLAATATPAPNDFMELGNHAEFLGVMSYTDMLATFFVHDGGDTQKWRLKGHAENEFWKWMASWAVMLRKPSDLGYPNDGYELPPLVQTQHIVGVEYAPSLDTGLLFPMEARGMSERIAARRDTVSERVKTAVLLVTADFWAKLPECHGNLNTKQTDSTKLVAILNTLRGSKLSEAELPRKTGNTCAPTTKPTKTSGSVPPKSMRRGTPPDGHNTSPESGSGVHAKAAKSTNSGGETAQCEPGLASELPSTKQSLPAKADAAPSAGAETPTREDTGSTSITATTQDASEDCSVTPAMSDSANSRTSETGSHEPSNISTNPILDRWVIWCQLNSEQDALERAFGGLCVSVRGSHTDAENERAILSWLDSADRPILISKPSMLGFGLNMQCCHKTIFVGLNDSFEQVFQAVRRFWRFGQSKPVTAHFIAAETEGAVVANLKRKEADAERMAAAMVMHMADLSAQNVRGMIRDRPDYSPTQPVIIPDFVRSIREAA